MAMTPLQPRLPSWHERTAARRLDPRPCEVAVLPGYPYDCTAARLRPDDIVLECRTHGCWWTVNPTTGRDRADELDDMLAGRSLHQIGRR